MKLFSVASFISFIIVLAINQGVYSLHTSSKILSGKNCNYLNDKINNDKNSYYKSLILKEFRLLAKRRTNISKERSSSKDKSVDESTSNLPLNKSDLPVNDNIESNKLNSVIENNDELIIFTNEINKIQQQQKLYEKTKNFANLQTDFQADFNDFQNKNYQSKLNSVSNISSSKEQSEVNSIINQIKSFVTSILIADFFVVMIFLLWFILAAALQSTYPVVLERFQDIFQPIVVPSLTVLMVGSIASGVLENQVDKQQDQKRITK